MLRDLNVSAGGKRICGIPRVGVLGSDVPTGFPLAALLLNDIDSGFPNRLYSVEILTVPSAGTLYVDEVSWASFTGAPDGTYTGTQRVRKYDPGVGIVSTDDGPYSLTIGASTIAATLAWTEGSETFAASGTVAAPGLTATIAWVEGSEAWAVAGTVAAPGVSAALGWTEGSEVFAVVGVVSAPGGDRPYVSPSRTVVFEGCTTTVRF